MANIFRELYEQNKGKRTTAVRELARLPGVQVGTVEPGSMYLFNYQPKFADTLPYYDTSPLVIPIDSAKGGFRGLNLHYLPPRFRATLMDELFQTSTSKELQPDTRLQVKYDLLAALSKSNFFKPCLKHYLANHVRSQFTLINPEFWGKVVLMPLANFVKASSARVYADSSKVQ